jgi:sulfur-oxidizing protein SoxX
VVFPADGKLLGDWKEGAKIANNGRGGQFSDDEKTVAGGNCYACHQMELKELSYGTLGPSLTYTARTANMIRQKPNRLSPRSSIHRAVVACSNMPRFGANKVLSESRSRSRRIPVRSGSPVNK